MNLRKASIDDIDLLIRIRIDYLNEDKGHLTEYKETAIRSQLAEYYIRGACRSDPTGS
jgi:hypothetical protein